MKKSFRIFMLVLMMMLPIYVFGGAPFDTVKMNVGSVLEILGDPKLKGDAGRKVKEQKLEVIADKMFDYIELSKRTLGLNWNKFTQEQRKEFVDLFKMVLKDAYVDKIMAYTNERVNFTKEVSLSETTYEIQSVVMRKSGEVPIFYRAIKKENSWKVYDVIVEGVSLINNYRTQFREILGNNPPETLLETLRKKVGKRQ